MSMYAMHYRAASGVFHTHHILASDMQAAGNTAWDIAEQIGLPVGGFSVKGLAAA